MISKFFEFIAKYDIWSLLSLFILFIGTIAGYLKFYKPRGAIKNFTVTFNYERAEGWIFPLRITVIFSNYTGKNVHIASASFKFKNLNPDPRAMSDTHTGKLPLKFPKTIEHKNGSKEDLLMDYEYFLKVDETTGSYAPLDPKHKNDDIEKAFKQGKVGVFNCYVSLLSRDHKPIVYRLKIRPKRTFLLKS